MHRYADSKHHLLVYAVNMLYKAVHMLKSLQLLGVILSLSLAAPTFALTLNGIAKYELLRKEIYIASLFLSERSDNAQTILTSSQNKRMAIKVTSKRWSPRRWSRMWQNDIAINNPFVSDDELIGQLMMFSGFLDAPLVQGDEIIIDYVVGVGTNITINNVKIISTTSGQLFNLLANAWIGKLPPSGEFKRRILGTDKDALSQTLNERYNGVNYTNPRSQLISSWIKTRKDAELAELKKKAKELADVKAAALAKVKKEKARADKDRKAKSKKVIVNAKPKPVKTYVAPRKVAKKKKFSKPKKIASVKRSSKKLSKEQLAAQNKYYLDLYQWELKREIRSAINYPQWALKFGQKGTVKINFTVTRKGVISKLTNVDDNISELLTAEVQNAIKDVVPFILPPDALSGSAWAVSFSYKFDPKSRSQSYLKKPVMPASLSSSSKLSRAQYKKILSQYIDEIRAMITDNIKYPVWSKKLKHTGTVEIEIQVNREGLVESSKDIKLTRHENLNQEVRSAIEKSQPLPSIPEALKLNSTKLKVKYKFK